MKARIKKGYNQWYQRNVQEYLLIHEGDVVDVMDEVAHKGRFRIKVRYIGDFLGVSNTPIYGHIPPEYIEYI